MLDLLKAVNSNLLLLTISADTLTFFRIDDFVTKDIPLSLGPGKEYISFLNGLSRYPSHQPFNIPRHSFLAF